MSHKPLLPRRRLPWQKLGGFAVPSPVSMKPHRTRRKNLSQHRRAPQHLAALAVVAEAADEEVVGGSRPWRRHSRPPR
jgi:hypothetical protein